MSELHISIAAEPLFNLGSFEFTNSMLVALGVSLGLSLLAINATRYLGRKHKPRWVVLAQTLIESFYDFVASITPQHAVQFFPLVMTIFLFVIFGSWAGLVPGIESIDVRTPHGLVPLLRGATADVNTTFALAIFAMTSVQVFGYKHRGLNYFKKFLDLSNPINLFIGFLELISEFSRTIAFAFRLFGNIFAGEVLLAVIAFLLPLFASLPFLGLEVFVGFIQALVFATLTLAFINIATAEQH